MQDVRPGVRAQCSRVSLLDKSVNHGIAHERAVGFQKTLLSRETLSL